MAPETAKRGVPPHTADRPTGENTDRKPQKAAKVTTAKTKETRPSPECIRLEKGMDPPRVGNESA